jgi:hypothetical protein
MNNTQVTPNEIPAMRILPNAMPTAITIAYTTIDCATELAVNNWVNQAGM